MESQVSQSSSRGALGRGGGKIGRGRAKRSLGQFLIQPKKKRSRKSF